MSIRRHNRRDNRKTPSAGPWEFPLPTEGGLYSEAGVIEAQARQAQPLKDRENLLKVPIRLCFLR